MRGICLDSRAMEAGLFQKVIQYESDENVKVTVISPESDFKPDSEHIRKLPSTPRYNYRDQVSPCDHPDMTGVICDIFRHFKLRQHRAMIACELRSQIFRQLA